MGRISAWWSRQSGPEKAAYGAASLGGVAAIVAAVIAGVIPVAFGDDSASGAGTTPTRSPQPAYTTSAAPSPTFDLSPSPTPTPSATEAAESPTPSPDGTLQPAKAFLYDMDAMQNSAGRGAYTMSSLLYDRSVKKGCGYGSGISVQVWSSAGYQRLAAMVGVADNEPNAVGEIARVAIRDQDGRELIKSFDVSLGHPKSIDVDLKGAVQIQITCAGRDSKTSAGRTLSIVLGNAALTG